ncbi:MAG: LysM peptidoglycan-binding domain-containing protein [Kiritimatiellaeota bacterium]|nr:LysM peptidoglycan-binding domain-containing protein [Kiritimatiellota bacterium]
MKNCHILFCLAALGGAAVANAQDIFARKTPAPAAADETPRENARAGMLLQQVELLAGQLAALRQDYARLEQRVTQAEQGAAKAEQQQRAITALQNENAKLRDETRALRDELTQAKADREAMRKQITDDIIARIEKKLAEKPPAPAKETGRLHVVEAGQTLSEIAAAYKSNVAAIMKANNIANANQLRIGQELFIPD